MNYHQQPQHFAGGSQHSPAGAARPMRPTNPSNVIPQNMSPNVVPSPQQQQMAAYQQMYHHSNAGTPFSPLNMYNPQMIAQQQQSHPQQQLQQPLSNAPATPSTPQMQQQSVGPASVHTLQQPGSVQHPQPGSVGVHTPAQSSGIYSVGPHGGPASNQPIAGPHSNPPPHQTALPTSAASSSDSIQTEFDPIASAKMLILKDLRRSIVNLNQCAERVLDIHTNPAQQPGILGPSSVAADKLHDEKKPAIGAGGPHSNLGLSVGGPLSNLGPMNPHSVQNPLSVQNPQSANPQSVSGMAPGSVKSTSEEQLQQQLGGREGQEELSAADQYVEAKNQFMNVCDNIERNMLLVLEVYRQQGKLYNKQENSAVAWVEVPSQLHAPTTTLPQVLRGYTELMNADKQAIRGNIDSLNSLLGKLGGDKEKRTIDMD